MPLVRGQRVLSITAIRVPIPWRIIAFVKFADALILSFLGLLLPPPDSMLSINTSANSMFMSKYSQETDYCSNDCD